MRCLETQKLEQLEARMDEIAHRVARHRTNAARERTIPSKVQKITFLIDIIPFPMVLVEGTCDHSHSSGMLTAEDHRELAQRCLRLAKTCTNPSVAEQLLMLAASYLELAERALRLHQPPLLFA